jgi:DNA-binding response OmpR family regulator
MPSPSNILIAVRDQRLAMLLAAIVGRRGEKAVVVEQGVRARTLLEDGTSGVVIDLDGEGWEVLAHLERKRPDLLERAIVLCWPLEDTHRVPAGVGAVLRKPIDLSILERTVAACWTGDGN